VLILFFRWLFDQLAFEWPILIRRIPKAWLTQALVTSTSKPEAIERFASRRRLAFVCASEIVHGGRWLVLAKIEVVALVNVHHYEIDWCHSRRQIAIRLHVTVFSVSRIHIDNRWHWTYYPLVRSSTIEIRLCPLCGTWVVFGTRRPIELRWLDIFIKKA
jgi:hypothetical protein